MSTQVRPSGDKRNAYRQLGLGSPRTCRHDPEGRPHTRAPVRDRCIPQSARRRRAPVARGCLTTRHMALHHIDKMAVEDEGEGEAIVCLHGLGGTSNTWTAVMPALAGYRVVRLDLPGS